MSLLNFLLMRIGRGAAQAKQRESVGESIPPAAPLTPVWFNLLNGTDDDPSMIPPDYDGSVTLPDKGWMGLTLAAQASFNKLLSLSTKEGVIFRLSEGFRPRRRQAFLYAQGRELRDGKWVKVGGTVTNALPGKSNHQSGRAFDISLHGTDPYNIEKLTVVGTIAERECGLQWGVDWNNDGKRDDLPHFQLKTLV